MTELEIKSVLPQRFPIHFILPGAGLKLLCLACLGSESAIIVPRWGGWGLGLSPSYRGGVEAQRTLWEGLRDKLKAIWFGGGRAGNGQKNHLKSGDRGLLLTSV